MPHISNMQNENNTPANDNIEREKKKKEKSSRPNETDYLFQQSTFAY